MVASVVLYFTLSREPFSTTILPNGGRYASPSSSRSHHSGLNSDAWIPLILDECVDGLHRNSAPCIQKRTPDSNLIKAQELIYRSFRLRVPRFISEQQKTLWLDAVADLDRMRVSNDKEWADYPTTNAQNLVFSNTQYTGSPPPDDWSSLACMSFGASHQSFLENPKSSEAKQQYDHETLVVATSPDSWSWQHFLDRVTVVWTQSLFAMDQETRDNATVLSGRKPNSPFVDEMYNLMGVKNHHHYQPGITQAQSAKTLIFSCRAPLIHPYTTQRVSEMMGVDIHKVPLSERKVVLYMSRSYGDVANSGRRIMNEEKLLHELEGLLRRRGLGEQLVLFDRRNYTSVQEIAEYFSRNVRAIIAPHGSALHNGRFASANTLILEFMPVKRFQSCFWEQSHLLEQNYLVYMAESWNENHDMEINEIESLIHLLDQSLGQIPKPTLVDAYPWLIEP
ncbi:hypothetical protein K493DRAFT_290149 [Basidiobolus meristosporus CBS 931.73]|uniref:Glycosyltransferase 61 catalytic domain-containing protein n=1 Tax=Basidiobolus meristosporus CBS 931.73 TaxID=1314790 RepID=A0A1Y1XSW4_9FUNG|nr:hypothetical protein K493DRAFT_290149 [Basidiobolus meristosporus CBS 931.73]|eukprot:ORX88813.1 hypothetical protein K493DRAFT_290149 [Basidiobolus meristosporus CBS 931.73]